MLKFNSKRLFAGVLSVALGAGSIAPAMGDSRMARIGDAGAPVNRQDDNLARPTNQNLPAFLKDMGYKVTKVSDDTSGGKLCTVEYSNDGWTFVVEVSASSDSSIIWVSCLLDEVPAGIPASALLGILGQNESTGFASFSYSKARNRLILNLPIENVNLTETQFEQDFQRVTQLTKDTYPTWDMSKFKARQPAPVDNDNGPVNNNGPANNNVPAQDNGPARGYRPAYNGPANNGPANNGPGNNDPAMNDANTPVNGDNNPTPPPSGGYRFAR